MFYLLAYLTVGLAVALVMALIQSRREPYDDEPDTEHTTLSVYVLVGLAWPISAVAFCYGLLSHLLTRTAPGDGAS
jgi:hypothetical protein